MTGVFHGGDPAAGMARFETPADGWVDLSTGINPYPWPVDAERLALLTRLPTRGLSDDLLQAAGAAYGVSDIARIVAAPGTQALIQWLPRLFSARRVAVLSPTYGEHMACWREAGHDVVAVADLPDISDAEVVVLTRPNNPDGRIVARDDVLSLANALAGRGGCMIVDEAFADLDPSAAVTGETIPGLICLRSFGKFFGLPGLRLGFAVTDPDTARKLASALGPWAVSTLAAGIGVRALSDTAWQSETRARLATSAARLDGLLRDAGLEIIGGTDLYRFCGHDRAADLHETLGRAGIYVRRFEDAPNRLRFGLPGPDAAWQRLERALAS